MFKWKTFKLSFKDVFLILLLSLGIVMAILALISERATNFSVISPHAQVTEVQIMQEAALDAKKVQVDTKEQSTSLILQAKVDPSPNPKITPVATPKVIADAVPAVVSVPIPVPTPISTSTPSTIQVTLSVNGEAGFDLSLGLGTNQCDVLVAAANQGKISSLNMRYDQNLQSNAVYQINGVGRENSVWWVYTINGKSAAKGCSHLGVVDNDVIEWRYIGS